MAIFMLIPGAWHGAWCWERVTPGLQAAGHRVVTPDLVGMGEDRTPLADVSLAVWAEAIAELIKAEAEPVVLVGHSRGGIVISETAERVPERIATLVYLTALLLPDGANMGDAVAAHGISFGPEVFTVAADNTARLTPWAVRNILYDRTDAQWQQRAVERVGAEPMMSISSALHLTDARFGRVRRGYIECTEDRTVPIALQRAMQVVLPCDPVITLESDHSPFYSMPDALCEALLTTI